MNNITKLLFLHGVLALLSILGVHAQSPNRFYDWEVTYGTISPLGVPQRGILINGQFPGPLVEAVTDDNLFVNILNKLDEEFLITWNGLTQKKTSWQDGVLGTNCGIPPNSNWTYKLQAKDQIGSFMYFPSIGMQRLAGGFGAFNIYNRSNVSIPYPRPYGEHTLLIGDWYKTDYKIIQKRLDNGYNMPMPDGLLINGDLSKTVLSGEPGKTYLIRVANVGVLTSINIRIQEHMLKLVEVEGSHVVQNIYDSLDVHPGQSLAFLVTLNGAAKDYYIVASTRFARTSIQATAILHYKGSNVGASLPLPAGPTYQVHWSMKQARTIKRNLTANAGRAEPQGSYRYGEIPIKKTLIFENSASKINGKLRFGVNNISYVNPDTPVKLADYFNIPGVFELKSGTDQPAPGSMVYGTPVYGLAFHDFIEIIFQNSEPYTQSWHLDGYNFFVVGFGANRWSPDLRRKYNKVDAVSRSTVQVYGNSWTVILVSLDNKGMWNLRSAIWHRQYLGQQVYLRVWEARTSVTTETNIPPNVIKCGKAVNL